MLSPKNMKKVKHPSKLSKLNHASPVKALSKPFRKKENNISHKAINRLSGIESLKSSNNSLKVFPMKFRNTSVEQDLEKLENLTNKNSIARYDWLSIEKKLIELNAKKRLSPIVESDSVNQKFIGNSVDFSMNSIDLLKKYEKCSDLALVKRLKFNERDKYLERSL
ncbi:hypothetical protein SteCoe_1903 [Stentor coeruleus]|uniref:Uncharacterized protein n=1 Tax=Stentor coeruleus TaxID=5963 RepID=A0A1R2D0V0_9CILI|nr:hypothetical protein SteCoe_1903 [Stentor coeruleus]